MSKNTLMSFVSCLVVATPAALMSGCASLEAAMGNQNPAIHNPATTFSQDFSSHQIKAKFTYKTYPEAGKAFATQCAGSYSVTNYGSKDYKTVRFEISIYSNEKKLVAQDTLRVDRGLIAGETRDIPARSSYQLGTAESGRVWTECPKNMDTVRTSITAY
jgi:hypothetical protein